MEKSEIRKLSQMPKRIPYEGTFELTVRCNLHCKMCLFRHDDSENAEIKQKELSSKQWISLAEQVAKSGTLHLLITGGEPMLRSDFCEIWSGIYKYGFITELYTNATLITPKIIETLRRYPPNIIGVTIYGASPETYKKVCGNGEAFYQMIEGIHMLQTLPSDINYRITIINDNVDDFLSIEELVHKEFDANAQVTHTRLVTKAVRGGCADVESCRLSAEDSFLLTEKGIIERLRPYQKDLKKEMHLTYKRRQQPKPDRLTLFGCNAGMSSYTITWDGKLQGCQLLDAFSTNAAELGFKAAWEQFPFEVKLPPLNPVCGNCELKELCECCCAFRYAETGSLEGVPRYICENTKIINEVLKRSEKNEGKNL